MLSVLLLTSTIPVEPPQAPPRTLSYEEVVSIISEVSERTGANKADMIRVFECESPKVKLNGKVLYDTHGQSTHIRKDGTRENSWGIFQINLADNAHPEVLKEQAQDPLWSAEWTANQFVAGRAWQWP